MVKGAVHTGKMMDTVMRMKKKTISDKKIWII